MVNLTTTRSFRRTRQATISWITRASMVALQQRGEDKSQNSFVLDNLLKRDEEPPNWWTHPLEEEVGPLFRRELTDSQPRWLNAANRAGFFAGLKAWNWSRCGLGETLPGHYFTVRYELDRDNNNRYLRTILEVHEGVEPESTAHSQNGEDSRGRGGGGGRDRGRGGTYNPGSVDQTTPDTKELTDQQCNDVNNWADKLRNATPPRTLEITDGPVNA